MVVINTLFFRLSKLLSSNWQLKIIFVAYCIFGALMKSGFFVLFCFSILHTLSFAQQKGIEALRAGGKIHINGLLEEADWKAAPKAVDFLEINPTEGKKPKYPTEVSILYDDYAIYIGAMCYDDHPDSILRQMGERDDDLNADRFTVSFDTYDKKIDAFIFSVSASGVQTDFRFSDENYNAVWHSEVKVLANGWSIEMEIPFSALRFPNDGDLEWNVQFEREIRRTRSELQWALVSKNVQNEINYWGRLRGLKNLKNPVRLQFSPYISGSFNEKAGEANYGYGGGADMKFGLSEAFTLDMTLLPDFSQVISDNIVKNLGAFEVVFQEQRPFFQEGVDLFNLGNLFYSRRIGGVPLGYYDAPYQLDSNEVVDNNPNVSKLMNVTKVSGRTKKGLGVGFLNALTNETFATFRDTLSGREREVMTNPYVNYNIIALDQNLRNNSSIYFINLNTTRFKGYGDGNVSAFGSNLVNKKNTYAVSTTVKLSQNEDTLDFERVFTESGGEGLYYGINISKIRGEFRWALATDNVSPKFDPNDLGVNFQTNYRVHKAQVKYNKFNPFWKLNQCYNTLTFSLDQNYTTNRVLKKMLDYNGFATISKSFHSFFLNMASQLGDAVDLFESRIPGVNFMKPAYFYVSPGISSDYRRKFALDANIGYGTGFNAYGAGKYYSGSIAPIIRFNDKFTLRPSFEYEIDNGAVGFGGYDDLGNPLYGRRKVSTYTSVISAKYLFRNNLSLTLRLRHYWSAGHYSYHGDLDANGYLVRNDSIVANTDFNFNAFNLDMIFAWQLAPGSFLNVVYKNALVSEKNYVIHSFTDNLSSAFEDSPLNTVTVKFIYFFDVASFKRKRN